MENVLRLSIILLCVHLSFIPAWALSSVAFQLLTEQRDGSEWWGRTTAAAYEWSSFSPRGLQTGPHQSAKRSTGGWAMPASRQPRGFRCTELALSHDRLTDTLTRSGPSELQSHINAEETPAHTQLYPKLLWDQFKNTKDGSCRYSLCRILFLSKIIQTLMLILDNYATPPQKYKQTNKKT